MPAKLVYLRAERHVHKLPLAYAQLLRRVREEYPLKVRPVQRRAYAQMLPAAHGARALQKRAAHAHDGLGVAVAVRLQKIERADAVYLKELGVVNKKVALHLRQGGGLVVLIVFRERRAKIVQLVAADVQPRGERVPAEAQKMLRAGGERLEEVEAAAASARTLADFAVYAYHYRGERILLGEARGGYPYDALVPRFARQNYRPLRYVPGNETVRVLPYVGLYLLTPAV